MKSSVLQDPRYGAFWSHWFVELPRRDAPALHLAGSTFYPGLKFDATDSQRRVRSEIQRIMGQPISLGNSAVGQH